MLHQVQLMSDPNQSDEGDLCPIALQKQALWARRCALCAQTPNELKNHINCSNEIKPTPIMVWLSFSKFDM